MGKLLGEWWLAKVGIIISLTLNKWPSRVGKSQVQLGVRLRSPAKAKKNFHITHLCAIFKLTIVNFRILFCLSSCCVAICFSFTRYETQKAKRIFWPFAF